MALLVHLLIFSGTGTATGLSDDGQIDVPIGFTFNYYGTDYTDINISSNGALSFNLGTLIGFDNNSIPRNDDEHICVLWDDWDPTEDVLGEIYYEIKGTAPNRKFIVQWHMVEDWAGSPEEAIFEAILYEGTNNIEFYYPDVITGDEHDNGGSATIGLNKGDGTDGTQISFNDDTYLSGGVTGLGFSSYVPKIATINSPAGSYRIGDNIDVTINFDSDVVLNNGNMLVNLSNGKQITISELNGSPSTATGSYTVAEGDTEVSDVTITSITLSDGATLGSVFGFATDLTLPVQNLTGVDVDGIRPTLEGKYNQAGFIVIKGSEGFSKAALADKKRGANDLTLADLDVVINGGTATLGTLKLIKQSDSVYLLDLDLQGTPDGNEVVTVTIKSQIEDDAGNETSYTIPHILQPIQVILPPAVPLSPIGILFVFLAIGLVAFIKYRFY